jgi:tRNA(His) 5'-end guanylyltransferase
MASKDSLGDRMKSYYEDRFRVNLPRRTNILIRLDGKAFHTYTKGLKRPFDDDFSSDMDETTRFLCENIQGAKIGYVQSDEISILITDYETLDTSPWFDNNLQKMCSVSASLATAKFNQLRMQRAFSNIDVDPLKHGPTAYDMTISSNVLNKKLATFDSRVFIIPEAEEVVNYFIWRQQDATRNSISMAAQSEFSTKQLHGKSGSQMQDMMFTEKGVNWNDYPFRFKRGAAIVKLNMLYKRKKGTKGAGEVIGLSDSDEALMAMKAVGLLGDSSEVDLFENFAKKLKERWSKKDVG